jgi:hypothetical protein
LRSGSFADRGALLPGERALESLGHRGQVLRPARADHDLGDPVVGKQPGEREAGHRGAAAGRDGLQPVQRLERPVGDKPGVQLRPPGHPRVGRVGRTAAVLAGQPAARQRAEGQVGDASRGAQRQEFPLVLPCEQRVAVLDSLRRARIEGGRQLPRVEVADPVAADQAVRLGRMEGAKGFRERHRRVVVVGEVQVDVADAQPVQAGTELAGDAVRLQPVAGAGLHRVERFGREPRPDPAGPDPAADDLLAAAAAIGVGRVEVRDAGRPGRVHQLERLVVGQPLAEELRC